MLHGCHPLWLLRTVPCGDPAGRTQGSLAVTPDPSCKGHLLGRILEPASRNYGTVALP